MSLESIYSSLEECFGSLKSNGPLEARLNELSSIITQTHESSELRKTLKNHGFLSLLKTGLSDLPQTPSLSQLRLIRGILILLRNISASEGRDIPNIDLLLSDLVLLIHQVLTISKLALENPDFYKERWLPVCFQCLSNMAGNFGKPLPLPRAVCDEVCSLVVEIDLNEPYLGALLVFLNNLYVNSEPETFPRSILDHLEMVVKLADLFDRIYTRLDNQTRDDGYEDKIMEIGEDAEDEIVQQVDETLVSNYRTLHKFLERTVSLSYFLSRLLEEYSTGDARLITLFELCHTIFVAQDPIYTPELVSWLASFYLILADQVTLFLENNSSNDVSLLHTAISMNLELLAHFSASKETVMYLNSLKFLEKFIALSKTLHDLIKPISKLSASVESSPSQFPHVKKLLIQNMGILVAHNFENQELMRTQHGLEVVLSNCIIDQLNPFIKETAILCIRYTLEKNPQNQEFVRKLEAKQVLNPDELAKAGLELEIENGKVKMKNS